jgi:hypothetical protein
VPEGLNAVNHDYRNIVSIPAQQRRISFDIHLVESVIIGAVCGANHGLRDFTEMAAGLRVDSDFRFLHWEMFSGDFDANYRFGRGWVQQE